MPAALDRVAAEVAIGKRRAAMRAKVFNREELSINIKGTTGNFMGTNQVVPSERESLGENQNKS